MVSPQVQIGTRDSTHSPLRLRTTKQKKLKSLLRITNTKFIHIGQTTFISLHQKSKRVLESKKKLVGL